MWFFQYCVKNNMFGLKVSVCQSIGSSDFDSVNTILSNSSFKQQDTPWCPSTDKNGAIYYMEIIQKSQQQKVYKNFYEENSIDDVGYGTDNDKNSLRTEILTSQGKYRTVYYNQYNGHQEPKDAEWYNMNYKCPDFYRIDNLVKLHIPLRTPNLSKLSEDTIKSRSNIGRFLCTELLGVIPGHFKAAKCNNQRLCIKGLDLTRDTLKKKQIRIGDCLRLVNDQEVTWNNIDEVFTKLCSLSEASVVVQQAPKKLQKMQHHVVITEDAGIVQLLPRTTTTTEDINKNASYNVMYLDLKKLNSEENNTDEDVLYQFPSNNNPFIKMRGAFVTTYRTLSEISSSLSCRTAIVYEQKIMNVVYHEEDNRLLILMFPEDKIHRLLLSDVLEKLVRVIRVQYNTLHEAFSYCANHPSINGLLKSMLYQIDNTDFCLSNSQSVQYLQIGSRLAEQIDCIVTCWESSECQEMSDSYYGCRRTYTVLGSSLFYKDSLISNHLPQDDLLDIYLYLKWQHVLSLCCQETIKTTIIWREIYPTRQFYKVLEEEPFGYTEPVSARWFWLIVAYKHTVLCTLLETNGYQLKGTSPVIPDPLLVDQAKATLMQIINLDMYKRIEEFLQNNTSSIVTSLYESRVNLQNETNGVLLNRHRKSKRFFRDSSLRFSKSANNAGFVDINNSKTTNCDSIVGLGIPCNNTDLKLTAGSKNCLLQYLHVDKHEGFYIKPSSTSKTDTDILHNFSLSCSSIKHTFEKYKQRRTEPFSDSALMHRTPEPTLRNIREEGVLFSIQSDNISEESPKYYWVVGRQRSLSETYVCFIDGTPQNTVDLAFKIAFGIKPG